MSRARSVELALVLLLIALPMGMAIQHMALAVATAMATAKAMAKAMAKPSDRPLLAHAQHVTCQRIARKHRAMCNRCRSRVCRWRERALGVGARW